MSVKVYDGQQTVDVDICIVQNNDDNKYPYIGTGIVMINGVTDSKIGIIEEEV